MPVLVYVVKLIGLFLKVCFVFYEFIISFFSVQSLAVFIFS